MANTEASVGHAATHACREPPGHPDGEGVGLGVGVGVGVGVGAGAVYVPLVTHPPHPSSRGELTALFNQHSRFVMHPCESNASIRL